ADVLPHRRGLSNDVVPRDRGSAPRGSEHRTQDAHRRRFAGAVWPQKAENLTGLGLEADVVHGIDQAAPQIAKGLSQCPNLEPQPYRSGHSLRKSKLPTTSMPPANRPGQPSRPE